MCPYARRPGDLDAELHALAALSPPLAAEVTIVVDAHGYGMRRGLGYQAPADARERRHSEPFVG
jgi:hypothetical protein